MSIMVGAEYRSSESARDLRRNMVKRRANLSCAAVVGVGLAFATKANGNVISQSFTVIDQTGAIKIGNFTSPTIKQFDTTLGILASVKITWTTTSFAQGKNVNVGNEKWTSTKASLNDTLSLLGPMGGIFTESVNSRAFSASLPTVKNSGLLGPGVDTDSTTLISGLAPWEAPGLAPLGTFGNFETTLLPTSGICCGKVVLGAGHETVSAPGTLIYTYLVAGTIPEPGTSTFLAAGVLGSLGMVIRRRKKK